MPEDRDDQDVSARPFWSGTITFGLVSIPVSLYPANRASKASLRMLGPNGRPLARRYYSGDDARHLDADDLVRGYEVKKDRFVEVSDDELERLAPERLRDINLQRFVDERSIPRIYFERGYFLTPVGSTRAYNLLAETMQRAGRAGIATFVMRGKEYLVAITADHGILRAETMRFHDELRTPAQIGLPRKQKAAPAAVRSFERVIAQRSRESLPVAELKDRETERLLKLVQRKKKSKRNIVEASARGKRKAEVIDLVEVLQRSLRGKKSAAA